MSIKQTAMLADYLSAITVEVYVATYGQCARSWRDIDYTPDYSKFYFICGGEGWIRIGDSEWRPQPGQLVLMPEGRRQSYSFTDPDNTYRKYWCHFSARAGGMNLFQLIDCPLVIQADDGMQRTMETIFRDMVDTFESKDVLAMLKAKTLLLELIGRYMGVVQQHIALQPAARAEVLREVLDYMECHIAEEVTVQSLAQRAHMHPNYFIRFFRERMGIPPMHYMNRKRIELAKQLLATTQQPVREIAAETGFRDLFYFSRLFKKNVGITATEYRQAARPAPHAE